MFDSIEIPKDHADLLGQIADAVRTKRVVVGGAVINLTVPFSIRVTQAGDETRVSIEPNPTVEVPMWPDPDLAFVGFGSNGEGRVVAKGRVNTYVKQIVRKP